MQDYLTDLEIKKINSFVKDEKMFDAVKKVLLASVYYNGSLRKGEKLESKNQAFNLIATAYAQGQEVSNEVLGQEVRGLFEGVNALENGFSQLKTIKLKEKEVESPYNEAI